ncbi:MAG: hypothetical protein ACTSPD_05265 [Promethearchaeota archaeon]
MSKDNNINKDDNKMSNMEHKKEKIPIEKSKISKKKKELGEKIKNIEKETRISIYLGAGLYQICVGITLTLLVSFLLGLPIIMAYPFITPEILLWIKIIGWFLIILGIITCILPIIRHYAEKNSPIQSFLKVILFFSALITIILIPIGIFLGLALFSELKRDQDQERKEKSVAILYFLLLFLAGLIHLIIGIILVFILPSILYDYMNLTYPYINYNLIRFLLILGWICLIPGLILILCSFWAIKLSRIQNFKYESLDVKVIRVLILISSAFITLAFPIGTFFGLTLLQEFYFIKRDKKNSKNIT